MAFPALKHSEGSGSTEVDVDFLKANIAAPGERDALQISKCFLGSVRAFGGEAPRGKGESFATQPTGRIKN